MGNNTQEEQSKWVIRKMFNYASDNHKSYLNNNAFNEIASVFLEFIRAEKSVGNPTRWVCNAPMGHGKTTVLRSLCRYLIEEHTYPRNKKALLIVIREKGEGKFIADELCKLNEKYKGKVKYVTHDNKADISSADIKRAQIVIITHARFKQLVLGCGDINTFSQWDIREKANYFGEVPKNEQYNIIHIPRSIIIDEMPEFENASVFDIGASDNCISWFDNIVKLPDMIKLISDNEVQKYRKLFNGIFNNYTNNETTDTTWKFINNKIPKEEIELIDNFYSLVDGLEDIKNKIDLEMYTDYIHFRKLLYEDGVGKIYRQYYDRSGEKIIVADFVPYDNIVQLYLPRDKKVHTICKANILILDGTGKYGTACYKKANFKSRFVKNYNDYTRLTLHHRDINTSSYSRSKEETVLKEIVCDFINLQKKRKSIFLLPAKNDIPFILKQKVLSDTNFRSLTVDEQNSENNNRLHILNTRGKNDIKDTTDLYLACLPRKSALYYSVRAVAVYGAENVDIRIRSKINDEDTTKSQDLQWFNDDKVEILYKMDLAAELLQIIHRTALRKINSKTPVNIYIAFEDIKDEDEDVGKIFRMMRAYFTAGFRLMENDAKYTYEAVYNGSIYGRNRKIENYARKVKEYLEVQKLEEVKLSKGTLDDLGKEIIQFLKIHNNWNENKDAIMDRFAMNGIKIEQRSERVKVFSTLKQDSTNE